MPDPRTIKAAARARDQYCRWPAVDHPDGRCRGPLEATHRKAVGMGGEKRGAPRTHLRELLTTCHQIHQVGRWSLEQHGRVWYPLTERGADGPVACFRVLRRDQWKRPLAILIGLSFPPA